MVPRFRPVWLAGGDSGVSGWAAMVLWLLWDLLPTPAPPDNRAGRWYGGGYFGCSVPVSFRLLENLLPPS
ncbi:MAG: hypothetical protein H0X31_02775 [Nostocaceae cyanobacterium]|nr:hypothetical protein [Nostocaceae cyanobacterium]